MRINAKSAVLPCPSLSRAVSLGDAKMCPVSSTVRLPVAQDKSCSALPNIQLGLTPTSPWVPQAFDDFVITRVLNMSRVAQAQPGISVVILMHA